MKTTLKYPSTENHPAIEKTIILIPREEEILITTEDGIEIATLGIQIMHKDIKGADGKYKTVPSKSFWLVFEPKSSETHPASADVFIEEVND